MVDGWVQLGGYSIVKVQNLYGDLFKKEVLYYTVRNIRILQVLSKFRYFLITGQEVLQGESYPGCW